MKLNFVKLSLVLAAFMCLHSSSRAALVIDTTNTQTLLTFDVDHAGVFTLGQGSNAGGAGTQTAESNQWNRRGFFNANKEGGLHTEGAAMSHQYNASGVATPFGDDANGDGDVTDLFGSNQIGAERAADLTGHGSNGLLLSQEGDFARSGAYFRILNDTGLTITDWEFAADVFYEETGGSASTATFGYAIDNGTTATAMSFTSFGSASAATAGDTYLTSAYSMNELLTTAGVADGDYIILGFFDELNNSNGSGIVIDNIGVTAVVSAVPEPGSFAVLSAGLGILVFRRRRSTIRKNATVTQ